MNQHMRPEPIPFIDIAAQRRRLGKSIDVAVGRVLDHCQFINGPEVTQLETALAAFCGAKHVITCANGTDALVMVLMAIGVGPGDAVLCPSFTFCATGDAGCADRCDTVIRRCRRNDIQHDCAPRWSAGLPPQESLASSREP